MRQIDVIKDVLTILERVSKEDPEATIADGMLAIEKKYPVQRAEEWCPVCKNYHPNPGVRSDAGSLLEPCPVIPRNDPRNRP